MKMIQATAIPSLSNTDFWVSVSDVQCPSCVLGVVRWAEAGRVPGYRICDGGCGQHWIARGSAARPILAPLTEVQPGCYAGAPDGERVPAGQPYRGHA